MIGTYVYDYEYDDMGNRTLYKKSRNGKVQESAEYTYNAANQMTAARLYDGKHYKNVEYTYDADGNRILQEEVKPDGDRKVELTYDYSIENRLKAVHDKNDLLVAMAYDGDGNRIFQLNYNLHTDDDWKGNSGNGNGNNKDNSGSGNSGNSSGNGTGSKSLFSSFLDLFTGGDEEENNNAATATASNATLRANGNKDKDKGNDGNDKNNGKGKGNGNGNSGNNGNGNSGNNGNGNSSTGGNNDNNGNANGNTNNTGGSQNQSGILFPIDGEVSELEAELIGMIKTTGKEKNYELVEYVNDVNREHVEVLMELNINGIMDTAYSYGNQRLTNERFTEWTGYYTYDPRGSVTGVTDSEGMIWQSYRYNANGDMTFGKPQYNNVYSYNAESYNPNMESQYLRARYYNVAHGNFLTEDSYLGNITDPLTLNRYNYVKSSPLNYVDPSGHWSDNMYTPNYQAGSPNNATSPYVEPFSGGNWNNTATNVGNQLKNGEILLSKNSDALQVSLKVAEGHGEVDWCAVGKGAASLILGMYVQTNAYSDNAIEWWSNEFGLGKYADALIGLAASSLVERFLDPEMYYTGKYLVDAYIYAKTYSAGKFMQTLNNIFSGEDTGFDQTASLGLTSYLLYSATETTTTGTLITVGGETIVGAATVSATATGVVVVLAGALILTIQASTNGASQESMQENKDKADSYKGEADSKLPNQGTVKGDVENAPSVDAGKQGKHVQGHPNYKEGNSTWQPGNNGVHDTQDAWVNGTELPDGTKVWDTGNTVGTNGETGVRVHIDGKGNIHGYPIDPGRYLPD